MRQMRTWPIIGLFLWLLLAVLAAAAAPLEVFVSIPPLGYIAEQLGRNHVAVHVLVPPGRDPHSFEPTPRQLLELGGARLYFSLGMPFENRLLAKILPQSSGLKVIDCTAGIARRPLEAHEGHDQDHDQQAPGPGEPDPHVWLAPPLIKLMAGNMAAALAAADPAHAGDYQQNLALLNSRLDAVDARIRNLLKPLAGRSFYVFHPAFGYFGDTYGLRQQAVEVAGKSPAPRQLAAIIAAARAEGVKIIFVQPQFDPKSAAAIAAAIGGAVVPLDDLAYDLLSNLEEMARKIEEAIIR